MKRLVIVIIVSFVELISTSFCFAYGILFSPPVNYSTNSQPASVFASDLDGDGDNDLAVANVGSNNISILINNGTGLFSSGGIYGAGSSAVSVVAADFDGNNTNDLAVANWGSGNVSILMNNGNGTFQTAVNYSVGTQPRSIFAADFNNDGHIDLVTANYGSSNVSILINAENGTFLTAVNYSTGSNPHGVYSVDLDNDGDKDLATANASSNNISVLKNNGNGTFQASVNYGAGSTPRSIHAADLDGDGDNDLVASNEASNNISVLKNNGNGTFQPAVNYSTGSYPHSIFAADFDNDGNKDLAVANYYSANVSILKNNGDGTFQSAVNFVTGSSPQWVDASDLDGDGDKDLVTANEGSNNISVLNDIGGEYTSGNALQFDGSDIVSIPHNNTNSWSGSSTFTIEFWIMRSTSSGTVHVLGKRAGCGGFNYQIVVGNSQPLDWNSYFTCGISSGIVPILNTWYHLAVAVNGTTGRFYINGALVSSTTSCNMTLPNTAPLTVGSSGTCLPGLPGLIDELRIWNYARDSAQIAANYNKTVDPNVPGLTGYWNFDESSGQTVLDLSQTGNNGTLGVSSAVGSDDPVRVASSAPIYSYLTPEPYTEILSGPLSNQQINITNARFSWQGIDDITPPESLLFAYQIDSSGYSSFSRDTSAIFTGLTEGTHIFEVKAKDQDGNEDQTPAMRIFIVDLTMPNTQWVSGPSEGAWVTTPYTTFTYSGTDNLTPVAELLYSWKMDSDTFSSYASSTSHQFTNLGAGDHTFTCKAKDKAGNEDPTPLVIHFKVEFVDLQPTLLTIPDSAFAGNKIGITWQVTNNGSGYINGAWLDSIYLSADSIIGGDLALGMSLISDSINSGEYYSVTDSFILSDTLHGNYWVILKADAANSIYEYNNETNNRLISSHRVSFKTPPIPAYFGPSSKSPFGGSITYNPGSGEANTVFEFRISYKDSTNIGPKAGYPRLWLDWNGNGVIDHPNDGYFPMSPSEAESVFTEGVDYSVFRTIPPGGNPKIKFEVINNYGGKAFYPVSGWLNGPDVFSPSSTDLYVYANDITFSTDPQMPQTGEGLSINARIHNNSQTYFDSVKVNMYIDNVVARSFYVNLPPRDTYGNPGFATISLDTIFNEIDYLEIEFMVDPDNEIGEFSETNNTACRGLIIGEYEFLASISINTSSLGSYYPRTQIGGSGSAWYEENGDSLEPLSGTPVYVKIVEGNLPVDTAYVNDYGNFAYSFIAPYGVGTYHLEITITDFTLTNTVTVPFQIVPPPAPNLIIDYGISGLPINACDHNILYISNPRVINVGQEHVASSKALLMAGTDTLLNIAVPDLNPGEYFALGSSSIPVTHTTSGQYYIKGIADYENTVPEISESDNTKITYYDVWCCPSDLNPASIRLNTTAYEDYLPVNILAGVFNRGGQPASSFNLRFVDTYNSNSTILGTLQNLTLPAYGSYGEFALEGYNFSDSGWHQITVTADPSGSISECREDNNVFSQMIYVRSRKPELHTEYQYLTVDNPNATAGDSITFRALVTNSSFTEANNFKVNFRLNGQPYSGTPNVLVSSITGGSSQLVAHPERFVVNDSAHLIEVYVDSGNVINEYNEGDNTASVPMPYDFYPYYRASCPGWFSPYFFSECSGTTSDSISICISIVNSGLFNFNDSLQINIFDSLAGNPTSMLIESRYVSGPFMNHGLNDVIQSYKHRFINPGLHYVTLKINPLHNVTECNYSNNSVTYSIMINSLKPDLVVQSEWIQPSALNPDLGDTLCVQNVDIHNMGDTTAFNVDVLFLINGDTLGQIQQIDSIGPSGYASVWPSACTEVDTCNPSLHIIRVSADPFNHIQEKVKNNNSATRSVIYCVASDLYVDTIEFEPECGVRSDSLYITAVIGNNGSTSEAATIRFSYLDNPAANWSDTVIISSIGISPVVENTDTTKIRIPWKIARDSTIILVEIVYVYPDDYNSSNDKSSAFYFCRPPSVVAGTVSDFYHNPLPGVHVHAIKFDSVLPKQSDKEITIKNNVFTQTIGKTSPPTLLDFDLVTEMWTNSSGHFSLYLNPGTYFVVCDSNGWDPDTSLQFIISSDTVIVDQDVILRRPGSLNGIIKNASNHEAIDNVYVTIDTGFVLASDSTNSTGQYSFTHLYDHNYTITFAHEDYITLIINNLHVNDGQDTLIDTALIFSGCDYLLGDINSDDQTRGSDVTYGVRYFKGLGSPPPDSCANDGVQTPSHWLYVAGDVNSDCKFMGSDITRLVSYFKGNAQLQYCHFFPPPPSLMNSPIELAPLMIDNSMQVPVIAPAPIPIDPGIINKPNKDIEQSPAPIKEGSIDTKQATIKKK